jgi:DNA-binding XRE family transcriptional regulator
MSPGDKQVGRRIQRYRLDAGWRQGEFARLIGVPQSTLCAIEQGERHTPARVIRQVCRYIGCEPNDLFGWEAR